MQYDPWVYYILRRYFIVHRYPLVICPVLWIMLSKTVIRPLHRQQRAHTCRLQAGLPPFCYCYYCYWIMRLDTCIRLVRSQCARAVTWLIVSSLALSVTFIASLACCPFFAVSSFSASLVIAQVCVLHSGSTAPIIWSLGRCLSLQRRLFNELLFISCAVKHYVTLRYVASGLHWGRCRRITKASGRPKCRGQSGAFWSIGHCGVLCSTDVKCFHVFQDWDILLDGVAAVDNAPLNAFDWEWNFAFRQSITASRNGCSVSVASRFYGAKQMYF